MKTHLIHRSLLVLALSSSALVAAPGVQGTQVDLPVSGGPVVHAPPGSVGLLPLGGLVQGRAIAMPGVFTERDAGTPISIPMNGKLRLSLHTDSKIDPIGSFWRPVLGADQNFQLMLKDKTTNNWFNNQGSEHQVSNTFFAFKPLVIGQTELSFELVQWIPSNSQSTPVGSDATASDSGNTTVIRTVTFPVTVVDADSGVSRAVPAQDGYHPVHRSSQGGSSSLAHDLSSGSW